MSKMKLALAMLQMSMLNLLLKITCLGPVVRRPFSLNGG